MLKPQPVTTKTPERTAIENVIKSATDRGESISSAQISAATSIALAVVKRHMSNLTLQGKVDNVGGTWRGQARYTWARKASSPVLTTPDNGPGFTRPRTTSAASAWGPAATRRICGTSMPSSDPYRAPELKVNPGILPERMAAYDLPSRVGNWRIYPDGRREAVGVLA